jgi:hypothetical protein
MDFLATNLEHRQYEAIADACVAGESEEDRQPRGTLPSKREYRIAAVKRLTDRHRELDLRIRYQGREFPESGSEYKVGGHQDGHLHVDFIKLDTGWSLKDIWLCR